jgi:hypothetical protein
MIEAQIEPSQERDMILQFVTSSNIGLIKGFKSIYDKN